MLGSTYQLQDRPCHHVATTTIRDDVSVAATQVVKANLSLGNFVIYMKLKESMDSQKARFMYTEVHTCNL